MHWVYIVSIATALVYANVCSGASSVMDPYRKRFHTPDETHHQSPENPQQHPQHPQQHLWSPILSDEAIAVTEPRSTNADDENDEKDEDKDVGRSFLQPVEGKENHRRRSDRHYQKEESSTVSSLRLPSGTKNRFSLLTDNPLSILKQTASVAILSPALVLTPSSSPAPRFLLGEDFTAEMYLCRRCPSGVVCGIGDPRGWIVSGTCVEGCTSQYCSPIQRKNGTLQSQLCQVCGPKLCMKATSVPELYYSKGAPLSSPTHHVPSDQLPIPDLSHFPSCRSTDDCCGDTSLCLPFPPSTPSMMDATSHAPDEEHDVNSRRFMKRHRRCCRPDGVVCGSDFDCCHSRCSYVDRLGYTKCQSNLVSEQVDDTIPYSGAQAVPSDRFHPLSPSGLTRATTEAPRTRKTTSTTTRATTNAQLEGTEPPKNNDQLTRPSEEPAASFRSDETAQHIPVSSQVTAPSPAPASVSQIDSTDAQSNSHSDPELTAEHLSSSIQELSDLFSMIGDISGRLNTASHKLPSGDPHG